MTYNTYNVVGLATNHKRSIVENYFACLDTRYSGHVLLVNNKMNLYKRDNPKHYIFNTNEVQKDTFFNDHFALDNYLKILLEQKL